MTSQRSQRARRHERPSIAALTLLALSRSLLVCDRLKAKAPRSGQMLGGITKKAVSTVVQGIVGQLESMIGKR
jgi:hypothetical protein